MAYLKKLCVVASLLAIAIFGVSCKKAHERVTGGGEAPDFTLSNLQGGSMTLSKLRGKVVLVEFWATWCLPCRESVPELNKVYEKFKDKNFELLGISVDRGGDALSRVRAFVKEYAIIYPIMVDSGTVNVAYGVSGIPAMFIIDKEGKVVSRHMGFIPGFAQTISKEIEGLL